MVLASKYDLENRKQAILHKPPLEIGSEQSPSALKSENFMINKDASCKCLSLNRKKLQLYVNDTDLKISKEMNLIWNLTSLFRDMGLVGFCCLLFFKVIVIPIPTRHIPQAETGRCGQQMSMCYESEGVVASLGRVSVLAGGKAQITGQWGCHGGPGICQEKSFPGRNRCYLGMSSNPEKVG